MKCSNCNREIKKGMQKYAAKKILCKNCFENGRIRKKPFTQGKYVKWVMNNKNNHNTTKREEKI